MTQQVRNTSIWHDSRSHTVEGQTNKLSFDFHACAHKINVIKNKPLG